MADEGQPDSQQSFSDVWSVIATKCLENDINLQEIITMCEKNNASNEKEHAISSCPLSRGNCFPCAGLPTSSFVFRELFVYPLLGRLDIGAGVEQPFGCLIVQNRQAVQSVGWSMDWTVEDDMVDGLFCATLTGRRGGHTPFVQAGAETSDTGAEAVEPDPGSSWEGHSGCVCTGVWN